MRTSDGFFGTAVLHSAFLCFKSSLLLSVDTANNASRGCGVVFWRVLVGSAATLENPLKPPFPPPPLTTIGVLRLLHHPFCDLCRKQSFFLCIILMRRPCLFFFFLGHCLVRARAVHYLSSSSSPPSIYFKFYSACFFFICHFSDSICRFGFGKLSWKNKVF